MPQPKLRTLLRHIQRLIGTSADGVLTDRDLLQRFVRQREEDAFAALVQRHGALVLNVARRLLHSEQDAEDVFQATFLLLARKASTVQWRDTVGPWLHSVALRLAQKLRTTQARRKQHERRAAEVRASSFEDDPSWREVCVALEEEVARLPERYRTPLLLCCWEGKSRDEAAQQLGWTLGTVKARLERGRDLLRRRLGRRGVVLSAGLLALSVAIAWACRTLWPGQRYAGAWSLSGRCPRQSKDLCCDGDNHARNRKVEDRSGAHTWPAHGRVGTRPEFVPGATRALDRGRGQARGAAGCRETGAPELLPPPKGEAPVAIARVDADGDPLPQQAIRRLGTSRWRMTEELKTVACSGDGKRLATASRNGLVQVWDTATGKELRTITVEKVSQVVFSTDGKALAASFETDDAAVEGVRVLDWATGKDLSPRYFMLSDRVYSLLLDGNRPGQGPGGHLLLGHADRNQHHRAQVRGTPIAYGRWPFRRVLPDCWQREQVRASVSTTKTVKNSTGISSRGRERKRRTLSPSHPMGGRWPSEPMRATCTSGTSPRSASSTGSVQRWASVPFPSSIRTTVAS